MFQSHRSRSQQRPAVPESIPMLSRGRHTSARHGACFMELASVLAGERWSDHPRCTHPVLGALARMVNDYTSDVHRAQLAELVPSVIDLTSDDPRVAAEIALRCAQTALPVVSAERQRILAVSILSTNRHLADLDGRPSDDLDERSQRLLHDQPEAARWAVEFTRRAGRRPRGFRRRTALGIVHCAVEGIAQACTADSDRLLRNLLAAAINDLAVRRAPGTIAARTAQAGQAVEEPRSVHW